MKSLKNIAIFLLIPYPIAVLGAFVFMSLLVAFMEGKISEWPTYVLQEAEAPPGYLVCCLIVLVVQFFMGALPIFFLRLFKIRLIGFVVSGLIVASLSVAVMLGGDTSIEFNLFLSVLFCLIIAGYVFSYTLLNVKSDEQGR